MSKENISVSGVESTPEVSDIGQEIKEAMEKEIIEGVKKGTVSKIRIRELIDHILIVSPIFAYDDVQANKIIQLIDWLFELYFKGRKMVYIKKVVEKYKSL